MLRLVKKRFVPALLLMGLAIEIAVAQSYPNKPITLVAPYGVGGDSDFSARNLAPIAGRLLGQNVIVQNGVLKINLIKEQYNGSNYTSARIVTKNKYQFQYGRVDIRAKLPAGGGTWPALWMLGSDINTNPWPGCGEIDIMEHVGNNLNRIYGTLHHPGHSGGNADSGSVLINKEKIGK